MPVRSSLSRFVGIVHLAILALLPSAWVCAGVGESDDIEHVLRFSLAPTGIACMPDGAWVIGVSQATKPRLRAIRVEASGQMLPFPTEPIGTAAAGAPILLDAIEAVHVDAEGVCWMLDNGRRSEVPPKVIAWEPKKKRLEQKPLIAPGVIAGSYVQDLVVDPESDLLIISDPAAGSNAALILLNRSTGIARRALQGHASVKPDLSVPLAGPGTGKTQRRLDGSSTLPHTGVRCLCLDRKAQWLYYSPVQSRSLYRLPMALLRDAGATDERLASAVEPWAAKPPCASFAMDGKGNAYIGDIAARAIGVIDPNTKEYRLLASDARLIWPDALSFGTDGKLYFTARAQLERPTTESPGPAAIAEHRLFRMAPLSPGTPGS